MLKIIKKLAKIIGGAITLIVGGLVFLISAINIIDEAMSIRATIKERNM